MSNIPYPNLRIAGTISDSIVDGPGIRYVIFTQGCHHNCPGCHNPQTHDFNGGFNADFDQILFEIKNHRLLQGVTFSGGEPFDQALALLPYAKAIKALSKNLMIYTGYVYEELIKKHDNAIHELLNYADYLVDGPFLIQQKNLTLSYRGSENQRVIDLNKTRDTGFIQLYQSPYDF